MMQLQTLTASSLSSTLESCELARTLPDQLSEAPASAPAESEFAFHGGRYELLQHVGTGAMATVWRALDRDDGKQVALKLLRAEVATPAEVRRLAREVTALRRVKHPCIVNLLDTGSTRCGIPFLVLELVSGSDLRGRLSLSELLPLEDVADIINQLGAALHHVHQRGLVHLDVKPENVLLSAPDHLEARLADFGLARQMDGQCVDLKDSNSICGTPLYMSPELVLSRPLTPASDTYSLAVMAYEMLSGRLPHQGTNPVSVMMRHVNEAPAAIPEVHPEVQQVLMQGLAKDPAQRPAAQALAHQLAAALRRHPRRQEPEALQRAA